MGAFELFAIPKLADFSARQPFIVSSAWAGSGESAHVWRAFNAFTVPMLAKERAPLATGLSSANGGGKESGTKLPSSDETSKSPSVP